jgi:putative chitinase
MQLSMSQFEAVMPALLRPEAWLRPIVEAMACFEIDTPARAAAFLAQVAHESNQCRNTEELLSFSAATLMHTWPRRFPTVEIAMKYERNPEMTANYVYANRLGNGDVASGDGFLFRGRGLIHVAGRSNYAAASDALGVDLLVDPDAMAEPAHAALTAAWFWQTRGLNQLADDFQDDGHDEDFRRITQIINGELTGLGERKRVWLFARQALGA